MNPDILAAHETLLLLNVIDQELDQLAAEQTRTPREIAEEHAAIDALQGQREATAEALAGVLSTQAEAEAKMASVEKRKAKAEARLPSLGTMGQIEATQREIAALSTEGGDLETAILEIMDDAEGRETALADLDALLGRTRGILAEHESAWAARAPVIAARVAELEGQREEPAASLRKDVARRYQLGRNQSMWKVKSGLTWADSSRVCLTCKCGVSARWLQECRDHTALHSCDGCKRMLVKPPAREEVEGEEPADEA